METTVRYRRARLQKGGRYEKDLRRPGGESGLNWITVSSAAEMEIPQYIGGGARQLYGNSLQRSVALRQPVRPGTSGKRAGSAIGKKGLDSRAAMVLLAALCLVLVLSLAMGLSRQHDQQRNLAAVRREIDAVRMQNRSLETKLVEMENGINVSYEAARMGMVSARSVDEIRLTVPVAGAQYLSAVNESGLERAD